MCDLYTSDCKLTINSNNIVKFADDTTVMGLISGGDKSAYKEELQQLRAENNLVLNTTKTKKIIQDFRMGRSIFSLNQQQLSGESLHLHLPEHQYLCRSVNTWAVVKRALQNLSFLRVFKKKIISQKLLITFFQSSIRENLDFFSVWFFLCMETEGKKLLKAVMTEQKILGCPLPSQKDIHTSCCLSRVQNIILHTTCLSHCSLAGITGPSDPEQVDSETASFTLHAI